MKHDDFTLRPQAGVAPTFGPRARTASTGSCARRRHSERSEESPVRWGDMDDLEMLRCAQHEGRRRRTKRTSLMVRVLRPRPGFTLIELLVVIAIIGLLVSILMPSLARSRMAAKSTVCLSRLRVLGQGFVLYANAYKDVMPPGRMPQVDDYQVRYLVLGGIKYRPTFLAMMGNEVGIAPFEDPQPTRTMVDRFGQPGDRQNYGSPQYYCPETPEWTDERNGSYGYNYQFLGNSRLLDSDNLLSYKRWPVRLSSVKAPAECVAVGDSMGTAATFPASHRIPHQENEFGQGRTARSDNAYGNEGFNLDPPRIDLDHGEAAGFDADLVLRTSVHGRHSDRAGVLWVDAHASADKPEALGYKLDEHGAVLLDGDNRMFSTEQEDKAWVEPNRW